MERFLDYFVPEKYVLDIFIDKREKTIGGKVTIFGVAKAENIKFHAVETEVEEVRVNGKKWDFENKDGVLTLFKVSRSDLRVEVGYHRRLNENMQGAYLSTYEYSGRTEVIVATQFESHYAREAFPCIDEPAAKAVFELTITTDKDDMVLANTTVLKSDAGTTVFEPTPRMSTYLLAFVIGHFHGKTVKNRNGVEITTYAALNQDVDAVDFANEVAARSLEFYDENFGVAYSLKKLTQVALPDFEAGAMENWGLVTYRETALLVSKSATLGTKKGVALTVTHELSHQWFGDLVTMEWWDDLWLNESFASIMEYFATDFIHPEFKIFEGFFTGDSLSALKRDAYQGVQAVHQEVNDPAEIATLFDPSIVYSKGARLMLMVIRMMGWEDFCAGLREYFAEFQYKNTVGDDLWAALNRHAEFDVGRMMHAFIDRPGYPVVTNVSHGASGSSEYFALPETEFVEIQQKRFLLDEALDPADWPLPAVREDMSGHYILNLSDAEFEERLARFDELGLEEKLRLLIDRDLVTKTDLASSASLLPLIWKFREETSAAVWSVIVTIVAGLKIFFKTDSAEEKRFKEFVKELVKPGISRIGLTTREGDDENTLRLRSILLGLDFYAENTENLKKLADLYNADYAALDPELRAEILDAKMYLEPAMLDEYLAAYEKEADPEIKFDLLFATTLTEDSENLRKLVGLLARPDVVKPQDQFYLYIYLYRNPKARAMTFDWLTKNWELVRGMMGDKSLDSYPRYTANSVRTEADFKKYADFFEPLSSDPALARAVEIGKNEIAARLRLIKKDQSAVEKALKELGF